MNKVYFAILLISLAISGCSDDDDEVLQIENQNPGDFTVTVTETTNSSSLLTWDPAIDPNGDTVTYSVFLNGNEIQSQLEATQFLLDNLSEQTMYTGMIVASDGNNGSSESEFNFTTLGSSNEVMVAWQKSLGGSFDDEAYAILQTADMGYIVAGVAESEDGDVTENNGGKDGWIVKLDAEGNIQWETSLGGTANETIHDIQQTADGGYIVGAFSTSSDGDVIGNNGMRDFWIVKLDASGNIVWRTGAGGGEDDILEAIIETSDGAIVAVGFTSSDTFEVSGQSDAWVVKLDENGELVWETNLGDAQRDVAMSVVETADLGYAFTGSTETVADKRDVWVVKLDQDGLVEWDRKYGGSENDTANSIQQTSDGGYIIGGASQSENGNVLENKGGSDAFIIKTDEVGNIVWTKSYGGSNSDWITDIKQTNNGGYIAVGSSSSDDFDVENNNGAADFWILRLQANGDMVWQQNLGGQGDDYAFSIQETSDGGFITAGTWYTNIMGNGEGTTGDFNYWVIKLE